MSGSVAMDMKIRSCSRFSGGQRPTMCETVVESMWSKCQSVALAPVMELKGSVVGGMPWLERVDGELLVDAG
jgi:hypothetical protein